MNVPRGFLHKKSRQASRQRHTTDCEPLVISTAATITIIPDVLRACGIHLRSDNSLSAVVRLLHFFVLTPLPWLAVFPLKTTTIHPYGISVYVHICHIYIYKRQGGQKIPLKKGAKKAGRVCQSHIYISWAHM
jgi:hypothetical protein